MPLAVLNTRLSCINIISIITLLVSHHQWSVLLAVRYPSLMHASHASVKLESVLLLHEHSVITPVNVSHTFVKINLLDYLFL